MYSTVIWFHINLGDSKGNVELKIEDRAWDRPEIDSIILFLLTVYFLCFIHYFKHLQMAGPQKLMPIDWLDLICLAWVICFTFCKHQVQELLKTDKSRVYSWTKCLQNVRQIKTSQSIGMGFWVPTICKCLK